MSDTKDNIKENKINNTKDIKNLISDIKNNIANQRKSVTGLANKMKFNKVHADDYYEVYRQYGKDAYIKYVPNSIRQQSIKNALLDGRYMDIYDIHGEKKFNDKVETILKSDIEYEAENKKQRITGWFKYLLPHKFKSVLKKHVLPISVGIAIAPVALLAPAAEQKRAEEGKKYQTEITEYLDDVREYGEQIKQYNLSPIQTMMKVTDDMWSRIEGYGNPELDLSEYAGIDVSKEMGAGVCRNMADDCARRLNAIDESYNARVIPVYCENGEYKRANIESKFAAKPEDEDHEDEEIFGEYVDDQIKRNIGNHAIVLLSIKEDGVTLVLDPTNAGIGIYHNDKIDMFNSYGSTHPVIVKTTPYGYCMYGIGKAIVEKQSDIISSMGIFTKEKISNLNAKYGVEAQNKALEEVRKIGKSQYQIYSNQDKQYDMNMDETMGKNTYTISMDDIEKNEENNFDR